MGMSHYISSLHDYCDRWCDRCPLKQKCAYIQGKLNMSENEESIKMLAWESKQYGLEMDERAKEIMAPQQIADVEEGLEADEVVLAATEFKNVMQPLLEDFPYWTHMAMDHARETASGMRKATEVLQEVRLIDRCRDTLCWDFIFIGAKVRRAVAGKLLNQKDSNIQSDSNGSAKVAMISIKRSLEALKTIFSIKPDEDRFLIPLSILSKIDNLMKQKFPAAGLFVRPGFDTEEKEVGSRKPEVGMEKPELGIWN